MNNRLRLGLALSTLCLSVVLLGAAVLRWIDSDGSPVGGVSRLGHLASEKTLGVNADLSGLSLAELEQEMAAMEGAGFQWLRQRFRWDAIETTPGSYEWAAWDAIVEAAERHSLELIAILDGSPAWARAEVDSGNPLAPPVEARDFGDFVAVLATRYRDQIDYYQVWDEPNIAPHWGSREVDPAAYVRLLREGSIRVRAADADAMILLAALAPNIEAGGENMSELLFLDAIYGEGAGECFDLVAAQPYGFDLPVETQPDPGWLSWRRVELLREVMEAHSDRETAIWAVSFGMPVTQPVFVSEAVEYARKEWPWMGAMLWAAWLPGDLHGGYALVGAEGVPEPALNALQGIARARVQASPGVYAADHPSGQYRGDWRITPLGADIGADGDRLTIAFQGTRLDLAVRRGDYRAFLFVTVDGKPANSLPRDAEGQAYVVLYDPLHPVDTVTLAEGLADGDHFAEIDAERGWGQWAILGWIVSREVSGELLWLPAILLVAAAVFLGIATWLAWPGRHRLYLTVSGFALWYRTLDERVTLAVTAMVAILLYVMVSPVPTLIVLGVLAVLLLLRPENGLPLISFALPFYQLGRPVVGGVFSMVEIVLVLTAVGWGANWVLGKWTHGTTADGSFDRRGSQRSRGATSLTPADWGVLALLAVGACSLLWAEHGREAAREFRTVILEASLFYGLLRAMLPRMPGARQEGRPIWRVVDAWVLGGALIALVGLGQWVLGENLISAEGVGRVRGFYGSPNNLALYLGRMLPLAVAIGAWGQDRRRRWGYGVAALLMAGALFLTYSRGAWIVGVPASLLFLAGLRGRRTLLTVVGVLVVLAIVVLLVVGPGRLTSLLDTDAGTTFFRIQLWRSSLNMLRDHPLFGVGLDNFLYAYRSTYVQPTAWAEFDLSHPHNLVLDFWLRLGIMGLVVIVWLLVVFFRMAWQMYRSLPEGNARLMVLGLMAGMVDFAAHGLIDNAFFLVDLAFVFMLMLACVQAVASEANWRTPGDEQVC